MLQKQSNAKQSKKTKWKGKMRMRMRVYITTQHTNQSKTNEMKQIVLLLGEGKSSLRMK